MPANPSLRERLEAVGSRIRFQRKGTQTYVRIDLAEQAVREWLESEAVHHIAAREIWNDFCGRYGGAYDPTSELVMAHQCRGTAGGLLKALASQLGEKDHG